MALPGGLATVTVTVGPYTTADGTPLDGTVVFQPEARAVHTSGAVVLPAPVGVTLDASGAGSVTLPASDAPGLTPNPLGYWVFWRLTGAPSPDPQRVLLPAAAPTVDLDQLIPSTTPAGVVAQPAVTSVAGLTGSPSVAQLLSALGLFVPPNPPAGQYVLPVSSQGQVATTSLGNGTLRMMPWILQRPLSITRIGGEIATAGQAGSVLRMGLYADDGTGRPGALIVDAGTIPGDAVQVADVPCAVTLSVGLVWIGGVVQGAPTTAPSVRSTASPQPVALLPLGTALPASAVSASGLAYQGTVAGALPAQWVPATSSIGSAPRLFVKTA